MHTYDAWVQRTFLPFATGLMGKTSGTFHTSWAVGAHRPFARPSKDYRAFWTIERQEGLSLPCFTPAHGVPEGLARSHHQRLLLLPLLAPFWAGLTAHLGAFDQPLAHQGLLYILRSQGTDLTLTIHHAPTYLLIVQAPFSRFADWAGAYALLSPHLSPPPCAALGR